MWFFFFVYAEMSFLLFALQAISKTNTCYVLLSHIFCTHNLPSLFFFFFTQFHFLLPSVLACFASSHLQVGGGGRTTNVVFFRHLWGHWWHFRTLVFPSVFLAGNGNVFFPIPPLGVAVGNVKNTKAHFGLYESYAGFFFFFFPCCNCVGTKCARNSFAHKEHGKTMTSQDR